MAPPSRGARRPALRSEGMATRAGNSMGRYHDPLLVANAFAGQYYRILNTSPEDVHKFYHDESILGRPGLNGEMTSITTMRAIKKHYLSTELKGCSTEIENVDAQPSQRDGVLILLNGSFTLPNTAKLRFSQSVFLAPQQSGGYFVMNDVLRYTPAEPETPSVKERVRAQQRFHSGDNEDDTVENGSGDDGQLCVICFSKRRNAAFVPCGHLVCCCNCAGKVQLKDEPLCPVCRQDIRSMLRVYDS